MLQQKFQFRIRKTILKGNLTNYVPVSDKSPNHGHHSILGQYKMSWHQFQRRQIGRQSLDARGSCEYCTLVTHV